MFRAVSTVLRTNEIALRSPVYGVGAGPFWRGAPGRGVDDEDGLGRGVGELECEGLGDGLGVGVC